MDREWILRGDLSTSDNEFIKGYKKLSDNNSRIDSAEANGYWKNNSQKLIEPESTEFADNFIKKFLEVSHNGAPSNPQHAKSNLLSAYPKLEKNLKLLDTVYQYAIRDKSTEFNDFITDYKSKQNVVEITNNLEIFQKYEYTVEPLVIPKHYHLKKIYVNKRKKIVD